MGVYSVSCNSCGTSMLIRCTHTGLAHPGDCAAANFDTALKCRPGSGCCSVDHDHGAAANACPGAGLNHSGACPAADPESCIAVTGPGSPCPGGHCGLGVKDCTVCRPVTVTVLDIGMPVGGAELWRR